MWKKFLCSIKLLHLKNYVFSKNYYKFKNYLMLLKEICVSYSIHVSYISFVSKFTAYLSSIPWRARTWRWLRYPRLSADRSSAIVPDCCSRCCFHYQASCSFWKQTWYRKFFHPFLIQALALSCVTKFFDFFYLPSNKEDRFY